MRFFEKQIDRRSKNAMIEFLRNHRRYDTVNSRNKQSSYANRVKLHDLGLTSAQMDRAFDLLSSDDDFWDHLQGDIDDFTLRHGGDYTIGTNGRSGGYLVLYKSHYENTGYQSRCRSCGQLSYKRVADMPQDPVERAIAQEILRSGSTWRDEVYLTQPAVRELPGTADEQLRIIQRLKPALKDCTESNRCGNCGAEGPNGRVNFTKPHRQLSVSVGGIDQEGDFDDWSMSQLRDRVDLVCDFDRTCDQIRDAFIDMTDSCEVVEETIMVPKTVRSIVCARQAL